MRIEHIFVHILHSTEIYEYVKKKTHCQKMAGQNDIIV